MTVIRKLQEQAKVKRGRVELWWWRKKKKKLKRREKRKRK
jgi:hypothetical protein